jgi:nucleoside-triphosphatase
VLTDKAGRHILITGSPGVGKTTLIATLVDRLPGGKSGFITREVRHGPVRTGFMIETLDGRAAVLAQAAGGGLYRVGKYGVLTDSVRTVAIPAILAPADFIVIDEIGKMEAACEDFLPAVHSALSGRATVIATIAARGGGAIEEIKRRADVLLFEVTLANRDMLADILLEYVGGVTAGEGR